MKRVTKRLLAGVGAAALVGLMPTAHAQSAAPKFEVTSVRPCTDVAPWREGDMKGDGLDSSPERLHLPCSTVQMLIQEAYGNFADDRFNAFASVSISGGPDWMNSALYQIDAKAESPQSRG